MPANDITPFQDAADQVRNRIGKIVFAQWLTRSHWAVGMAGLLLVLASLCWAERYHGDIESLDYKF